VTLIFTKDLSKKRAGNLKVAGKRERGIMTEANVVIERFRKL
jgi:hypothetical protein